MSCREKICKGILLANVPLRTVTYAAATTSAPLF